MKPVTPNIYSVDSLTTEVKKLLEMSYADVWVEGEVSSVASPASGHTYFTLKDNSSVLKCVLFKQKKYLASTLPIEGARVLLRGKVSLYAGRGDVQLICSYIEAAGEGELRRQFDLLKAKLLAEGLFDEANKKPLPALPKTIALITSPQGAVLHDIIRSLQKRYPLATLKLYPASVQGMAAKAEILGAISLATEHQADVLILARGGGSLEDLHVFNDEDIARAIYHCPIPTISAIGHETDFVISDFVADQRALTPTAAVSIATPDIQAIKSELTRAQQALNTIIQNQFNLYQQQLDWAQSKLKHPRDHLQNQINQWQRAKLGLHSAQQAALQNGTKRLARLLAKLNRLTPMQQHHNNRLRALKLQNRLEDSMQTSLNQSKFRLRELTGKLQALSPTSTLERGYAIVQNEQGKIITQANQAQKGERIHTRLHKGVLQSIVEKTK